MSDGSCFLCRGHAPCHRKRPVHGTTSGIFPRNHRTDPKLFLMKRTFTLLAAALATTAAAQKPYHRDLAVLEVNREAPRTEFVEFASRDEALMRSFERSDAYRSLDGVWKFRYADDVRALPADATAADADTSAWNDIRVPGNWELQGHGTPIYVNTRYEYATIDPAPPLQQE